MIWISLKGNEKKKIRSTKNTWYDCLINYIPEPVVSGFKDKPVNLFNTNTPKQTIRARERKETNQTKKQPEENKINNIRKKENKRKTMQTV